MFLVVLFELWCCGVIGGRVVSSGDGYGLLFNFYNFPQALIVFVRRIFFLYRYVYWLISNIMFLQCNYVFMIYSLCFLMYINISLGNFLLLFPLEYQIVKLSINNPLNFNNKWILYTSGFTILRVFTINIHNFWVLVYCIS